MSRHRFNFLLYPNAQAMDIIGPWEVIATWQKLYPEDVEMQIVSQEIGPIQCLNNIVLTSHRDFSNAYQADYLIVPGGTGRIKEVHNLDLINFIQQQAKHCKKVISVCTGTFLLAQAKLLKNKSATTYWQALPELARHKDITICGQRIVKDGNIWSAGGISSGIDLAFALINDLAGEKIAGQVQLYFEYFPQPPLFANHNTIQELPRILL